MNREEYLKLVKASASFKMMNDSMKKKIWEAEGKEMEKYFKILGEEKKMMMEIWEKYKQEADKILVKFVGKANLKRMKDLRNMEEGEKEVDQANMDNLLKNI